MNDFIDQSHEVVGQDMTTLAGVPYVYHCHHFNLFHDQTIEDAAGEEAAFDLRVEAARRSGGELLRSLSRAMGAETPAERLALAARLFQWMGHGRLELLADANGGKARGEYLHYSFAWREKYGQKVRRRFPADAFGTGYSAAAMEVAFDLQPGSLGAREDKCFACREEACSIELSPETGELLGELTPHSHNQSVMELTGLEEGRVAAIAAGLKEFVAGVGGDARGLIQAFGLYVTRHLPGYYEQTAYDTIHRIERENPTMTGVVEELFGESGHVCVFYTFGNIMLSPEWEGLVGRPTGKVEDTIVSCTALARGLGFGHWTIEELDPDRRLVLRSSTNYEAPFYLQTYGLSKKPRSYVFANAARAFMQLAHRVDWSPGTTLDDELYQSLFKADLRWNIEQTHCLTKGDPFSEVVVTRG